MKSVITTWIVLAAMSLASAQETLSPSEVIKFPDQVDESTGLSGAAVDGDGRLFVVADEGCRLRVLHKRAANQSYKLLRTIPLSSNPKTEFDLEGLSQSDGWLYLIGSHSAKRERVKPDEATQDENHKRLRKVEKESSRRQILRIKLDSVLDNNPEIEQADLWNRIKDSTTLERFIEIPSKENGIDIEGIAADGEHLYIGFRGPVLRGGFAVVMKTRFASDSDATLLFMDLGGDGIRDLVKTETGFLILSGPVGDRGGSIKLHSWTGEDGLPGSDKPNLMPTRFLGLVPPPDNDANANAEGATVLKETSNSYSLMIVYDGPKNGAPTVFQVAKP